MTLCGSLKDEAPLKGAKKRKNFLLYRKGAKDEMAELLLLKFTHSP